MRALLPAICLLLASVLPAAATDLERLLGTDLSGQLAAKGTLTRVRERGALPGWLPAVDSREAILAEARSLGPNFAVEMLRVFRDLPIRYDSAAGRLRLYNTLRALSTMKGLVYWSASRGKERILFTESHAVAGPSDTAPLPDPVAGALPASDRLYSVQVDQTFGRHLYLGTYANRADHLVIRNENADAITYLLMPVMQPGCLVTVTVLVPLPDGVLLSGFVLSKTGMPVIDRSGREASLLNRLVALSNWIGSRLAAP